MKEGVDGNRHRRRKIDAGGMDLVREAVQQADARGAEIVAGTATADQIFHRGPMQQTRRTGLLAAQSIDIEGPGDVMTNVIVADNQNRLNQSASKMGGVQFCAIVSLRELY